jgi:hypothetical protein
MNAKVNLALLNTTRFDSGALGMLAMVIHQFSEPGRYRGSVLRAGSTVGDLDIMVDEKSDVMQLDIDLAAIAKQPRPDAQSAKDARDCHCHPESSSPPRVVSPKGYVLFHASSGSGFSVNLSHVSGKSKFDSTQLDKGDLFACSLLEPAQYQGLNTRTKAQLEIAVVFPTDLKEGMSARLKAAESMNVKVQDGAFQPAKLNVISTQGLVFQINEVARIVIEKKSGGGDTKQFVGPKARWQKFSPAPAATTKASVKVSAKA